MKNIQAIILTLTLMYAMPLAAQETQSSNPTTPASPTSTTRQNTYLDEIVATGQRAPSNHPGMRAFFDGDFVTAEISFEREFLKLKRGITARENASFSATTGQIRSESISNSTLSSNANAVSNTPSLSSNNTNISTGDLDNNESSGRSILTDGVVNDFDFSFSKYMAGLSQLQLGKFKVKCDDHKFINDAALELATEITKIANQQ